MTGPAPAKCEEPQDRLYATNRGSRLLIRVVWGVCQAKVDALAGLADFSMAIESWHNTAHMAIGTATGTPMMAPSQNIFFRPFWQLHRNIDDLFVQVLGQYGARAHANQFVSASAIASHLEAAHHGWVARI